MDQGRKNYEDRLGDGLERVLAGGADSLTATAAALNEISVAGPRGERWDSDLLASEFERLAHAPDER